MGKIFNAIERHIKESKDNIAVEDLKDEDIEALLSYNRLTGKLEIDDSSNGKNIDIVQRLIESGLILPNGKVTNEGKRKYEEIIFQLRIKMAGPHEFEEHAEEDDKADTSEKGEKTNVVRKLFSGKDKEESTVSISGKIENDDKSTAEKYSLDFDKSVDYEDGEEQVKFKDETGLDQFAEQPRPIDRNLITLLASQSYEAEQFKILRSNILFPHSGKAPRTILVTSANQAEGKSFVAANLAVSIASSIKQHVLLMDCDLRNPTVHRIFGFKNGTGLSDYLKEKYPIDKILLRTKVERLSLIPAGPVPMNPSELVSSQRMAELIFEVSQRYDDRMIVIDSPPPSLTAETSVLARSVDGIIVVVRYGKTSTRSINSLIETLGKDKIIGSVINRFEYAITDYYQGYGAYRKYGAYRRRN